MFNWKIEKVQKRATKEIVINVKKYITKKGYDDWRYQLWNIEGHEEIMVDFV